MFQSLLRSIGVTDDIRSHLEHVTLHVQRPAWLWLGLVLLLPLGWFIYRRQRENLASVQPALRLALTATRVLVLLLLVLTLAGPYLKLDMKIEKKPILALLFDQSQSMGLEAGPFDTDAALLAAAEATGHPLTDGKVDAAGRKTLDEMTRAEFIKKAVEHRADAWLKPLADKFDVRLYSVGKEVQPIPARDGAFVLPDFKELSPETHLGDGLGQVLDEAAGRQIASIVVFSDGQNTGGRSPAEMAQAARDAGAPVFVVPAGSDAAVQDIAVVDVFAPDSVMVKDTVKIAATVEVQGYLQHAVKVVLLESGKSEPVDAKDLVLRRTEQQRVELSYRAPEEPGAKTLTVKLIPAAPLERDIEANNSDDILIRVLKEERKLLYIEGTPRWDFRFIKNAVRRDEGLQGLGLKGGIVAGTAAGGASSAATGPTGVSKPVKPDPDIVLEAEVRRRPANERNVLPQTVDELARYDTIILGDVSPALVDTAFVKILNEAVRQRGVGLIVEAGPNAMPFLYGEEFLDLLPVKLRHKAGLEAQAYKSFKLALSPDGALHETMRLFDDASRNQNVWEKMPPFYWCAAVERPSPSATVLAYNAGVEGRYGKLPLIAHHYAGQGKVLFVGTDSTWLWRQFVGDAFFNKFWGQAIRFVARRSDDQKKSWVEVRPVRARPGETAQIELMAIKADGAARTDPTILLRVEREGATAAEGAPAETVEMVADKATLGRYTGKYVPHETGNYRVVYEPGSGANKVEAYLHVRPSTEELRRPSVDRDALAQIGTIKEPKDLASITGELKGEPKTISLKKEEPIWDNWLILTVLICIYSIDVGLRRLSGLS
ncbi:MAG TPA: vWA domain-containing protein [Pirellulales bacterium]|jgi:hypothetical protein|nr:vWA domain-containing protein [Pirellulales bacterium]